MATLYLCAIITIIFSVLIVRVYPGLVRDKLQEIGYRRKNASAFMFEGVNIFSAIYVPFIAGAVQWGLLEAIEVFFDKTASSIQSYIVLIVLLYIAICLIILYTESTLFYNYKNKDERI